MESQLSTNQERVVSKTSFWKILGCYITAFLFVCLILGTLIGAAKTLVVEMESSISVWEIFEYTAIAFLLFFLTMHIGRMWRSRKEDLKLGITDIPNPFFDPNYLIAPHYLKKENENLQTALDEAIKEKERAEYYVRVLNKHSEAKKVTIDKLEKKLNVFLRHQENASRLLGSAAYLNYKGEAWEHEMLNNILSECITCLEKDQSDKSVSLFKVDGEEIRIVHYLRLSASSAREIRFRKNEGFAGTVWAKGEDQYIPDVSSNPLFEGEYKPEDEFTSIVGLPINVNGEVLGVLCIQSEVADGFTPQDLRTLQFYARACSLIFVYNIKNSMSGVGGVV